MHTLMSAFFALLFSFSHAAPVPAAPQPVPEARNHAVYERVPSRHELGQISSGAVYAGNGCPSCRRTTVTYRVR